MARAAKAKVYVALYFETVVVVSARTRQAAADALRRALSPAQRREVAGQTLLNHVGLVYWSAARGSPWYRLPGDAAPCAIHPDRLSAPLRPLVPEREPDRAGWVADTSAARAP
jgi:hypothetical protein